MQFVQPGPKAASQRNGAFDDTLQGGWVGGWSWLTVITAVSDGGCWWYMVVLAIWQFSLPWYNQQLPLAFVGILIPPNLMVAMDPPLPTIYPYTMMEPKTIVIAPAGGTTDLGGTCAIYPILAKKGITWLQHATTKPASSYERASLVSYIPNSNLTYCSTWEGFQTDFGKVFRLIHLVLLFL